MTMSQNWTSNSVYETTDISRQHRRHTKTSIVEFEPLELKT
jgi:hypothetical protein